MTYRRIFLSILGILVGSTTASSAVKTSVNEIPSVGFFPTSFPGDPLLSEKYSEQTAVGQILETLVSSDANGELSPQLAQSWTIANEGKLIRFHLRNNAQFSDGSPLTAKDVVYSIKRHMYEKRSQSYDFLQDIASISAEDNETVLLRLKRARVAIFKALSRDQLGIVPDSWAFDPLSNEPIIGSGPYRLVKEGEDWYYVANKNFHAASLHFIPKWRLIRTDDEVSFVSTHDTPDIVMTATEQLHDVIKEKDPDGMTSHDQISFLQTSIWWYPHGKHYRDQLYRHFFMGVLRDLVALRRTKTSWTRATGLIPIGVSGFLPAPIHFPKVVRPSELPTKELEIKIAIFKALKPMFFQDNKFSEIEKRHGIKFRIITLNNTKDLEGLVSSRPDIAIDGWFGGFNDPEGFLPLLPSLLNVNLDDYLEDIQPVYAKALVEQDWASRADDFRLFNRQLVEQERLVPTWRVPTYMMTKHPYTLKKTIFRCTPRLTDIGR